MLDHLYQEEGPCREKTVSPPWSGRHLVSNPMVTRAPYPSLAQIVLDAKHDKARTGDFQHPEAPDLLWMVAILADHTQKDF